MTKRVYDFRISCCMSRGWKKKVRREGDCLNGVNTKIIVTLFCQN